MKSVTFYNIKIQKSLMVKSCKYYCGDALTKIGGGVFGGTVVGYYYNTSILHTSVNVDLVWYFTILGFGLLFLLAGYFLMYQSKKNSV